MMDFWKRYKCLSMYNFQDGIHKNIRHCHDKYFRHFTLTTGGHCIVLLLSMVIWKGSWCTRAWACTKAGKRAYHAEWCIRLWITRHANLTCYFNDVPCISDLKDLLIMQMYWNIKQQIKWSCKVDEISSRAEKMILQSWEHNHAVCTYRAECDYFWCRWIIHPTELKNHAKYQHSFNHATQINYYADCMHLLCRVFDLILT